MKFNKICFSYDKFYEGFEKLFNEIKINKKRLTNIKEIHVINAYWC